MKSEIFTFKIASTDLLGQPMGMGSGLSLDKETILTCLHVITGKKNIDELVGTIKIHHDFNDNSLAKYLNAQIKDINIYDFQEKLVSQGRVVKVSPEYDIAFIKIAGVKLQIPIIKSNKVIKDEKLYISGYPFESKCSFSMKSMNILSTRSEKVTGLKSFEHIEFTEACPEGFSGGPIIKSSGEVIGFVTGNIEVRDERNEKIYEHGFGIPIDKLNEARFIELA